ncbi:MAG: FAD-dependent oxidoreductase [Rhodothermales bacterium]|nr:FAD-dependent oxidoreductase [Rhodothermales bacterium]
MPPYRIAIIGAGPAGFYAAGSLLGRDDIDVRVDLYDRLPTPHGLVRAGVAPDHQKIKNVTRVFDKTAADDHFRFFGNVEYGRHVDLDDLRRHYHQICFTTGAQVDRKLGLPGEDLLRSHSATEFVAWYNGHPDYRDLEFDLTSERVAIIGVGNVAIDVARILCRTVDELAVTDIADYALEALAESRVREVIVIGRRGPAQAAFTNPEIKEMGELEDASAVVLDDEVRLDPLTAADLDENPNRLTSKKLEILESFVGGTNPDASRTCFFRFLVSPVELKAADDGGVGAMRVVFNRLEDTGRPRLTPKPTDRVEDWDVDMVFRSVGYQGVALPDIPFNENWGVIHNEKGRIVAEDGGHMVGCYAAGWIKRGPTGVIGTNKADAVETADCMVADLQSGIHFTPEEGDIERLIREAQPEFFSYADWLKLDELEQERGKSSGRPRVKFTTRREMLQAIGR